MNNDSKDISYGSSRVKSTLVIVKEVVLVDNRFEEFPEENKKRNALI